MLNLTSTPNGSTEDSKAGEVAEHRGRQRVQWIAPDGSFGPGTLHGALEAERAGLGAVRFRDGVPFLEHGGVVRFPIEYVDAP